MQVPGRIQAKPVGFKLETSEALVIGGGCHQVAARFQNAPGLRKQGDGVSHMFDNVAHRHSIERTVGKMLLCQAAEPHINLKFLSHRLDRFGIKIDAADIPTASSHEAQETAVSAADIKEPGWLHPFQTHCREPPFSSAEAERDVRDRSSQPISGLQHSLQAPFWRSIPVGPVCLIGLADILFDRHRVEPKQGARIIDALPDLPAPGHSALQVGNSAVNQSPINPAEEAGGVGLSSYHKISFAVRLSEGLSPAAKTSFVLTLQSCVLCRGGGFAFPEAKGEDANKQQPKCDGRESDA